MGRVLPILFNTDMVQAILEDRKTVTRRICKDADDHTVPDMDFFDAKKRTYAVHNYADKEHKQKLSIAERRCPICPGDILYVREAYCPNYFDFVTQYGNKHGYKADYERALLSGEIQEPKWTPSIHMPKEAARIWLKVTDVRVELLQDMDRMDAVKEGIDTRCCVNLAHALTKFKKLWDSTVPKVKQDLYGWEANPWVWVIEFERCEKPESEE